MPKIDFNKIFDETSLNAIKELANNDNLPKFSDIKQLVSVLNLGNVIEIPENKRRLVGTFQRSQNFGFVVPIDKSIKCDIFISLYLYADSAYDIYRFTDHARRDY